MRFSYQEGMNYSKDTIALLANLGGKDFAKTSNYHFFDNNF